MRLTRVLVYKVPMTLGVLGMLFLSACIFVANGLHGYRNTVEANERAAVEATRAAEGTFSVARDAVRAALAADTIDAWERAASAVLAVDDPRLRDILLGAILPKRILALGAARDRLVADAYDLAMRDQNDPKINELLGRAKPFEDRALELLSDLEARSATMKEILPDKEWERWIATMRYLEGYTQFARLSFLSSDEKTKMNEIVQTTLHAYAQIFGTYPGNERAEYAIESLYQTAKKQNSDSDSQNKGKAKRPNLIARPPGTSSPGQGQSGI